MNLVRSSGSGLAQRVPSEWKQAPLDSTREGGTALGRGTLHGEARTCQQG